MESRFNGDRLKSARLYNGFTLTELAGKVEISKQSLSLYENNKNIPDCGKVHALSRVLGFPFEYFFQENRIATLTETTYFRSLSTATKKDRTAQSVKLEYVAKMYEVLWNYLEFPIFQDPKVKFEGVDDAVECENQIALEEIENAAQQVRKYWDIGRGPIKDLQYLLEEHGILVTGFDTNVEKIDAFSQRTIVDGYDFYLIAVALGKCSECRLRFDMAHELGHIVLHPWSEDLETILKDEFKSRERQANMFASAFLLPRDTFGREVEQYPTDLNYYRFLKNKWKVSMQAMIYRTHQLGIISTNQYQYLMRQFSKNNWRTVEPDDVVGQLNESIFQGAIDCLFDNHILTPKSLLNEFKRRGIILYPSMIEELLHLRKNTLDVEEKVIPLFQIRQQSDKDVE